MNNQFADLHIHTTASDGSLTPQQLILAAQSAGLSVISFADHDSIEAYTDGVISFAEEHGIRLVYGLELSCRYQCKDVHILGYQIDIRDALLNERLLQLRSDRIGRCRNLLSKLKEHQMEITYEEVANHAQGAIGRVHIAKTMMEKGYVVNIKEAFERYLSDGCICYVEKAGLTVSQAIDLIHRSGGVSVLAHPKLIENDDIVFEVIDAGIQGIEVYHKKHNTADEQHYGEIAARKGLLVTAGSDFHGKHEGEKLRTDFIINERLKRALGIADQNRS